MPDSSADTRQPIDRCLERWHSYLRGDDPNGLDDLLDDSVVFTSPIVFTPQVGKYVTKLYLTAAASSLGGSDDGGGATAGDPTHDAAGDGDEWNGRFRYVRKLRDGDHAVLEFETTIGGKYVNGVDMITCNADGRIVDFKVMVRPLQAVNAVHDQMRAALESLSTSES